MEKDTELTTVGAISRSRPLIVEQSPDRDLLFDGNRRLFVATYLCQSQR